MAFRRLNIRAKKSLPGLCDFDTPESSSSSKSTAVHYESPAHEAVDYNLEDFGAILERCKGPPSKDSPSKCKKLFGSLRSLRSLANLHSSPSKTKQIETERAEPPTKHAGSFTTPLPMSPSLTLLNFEQSPSDRPMFELSLHRRSMSSSSLEVQHSSPMTVPGSVREMTPYNISTSAMDLPTGTVPNKPGPMQKAFDHDPSNRGSWQNASPTPLERYAPCPPVLTPLPGTNLSFGDVDPVLVPLPPSIDLSAVQISQEKPGYFDILVDEQPPMDNTDLFNGLACLKLADDGGDDGDDENNGLKNISTHACSGPCSSSKKIRCGCENAKLQDTVSTLDISQNQASDPRRKQQAEDLSDDVHALNVPQHHQTLPLRPKQHGEDLRDRVRKDSVISKDWELSTGMVPEQIRIHASQSDTTGIPVDSATSASPQDCKRTKNGNGLPVNFAYIVWDSSKMSLYNTTPENTWGRHTGLYDGTGYGDDDSGLATPFEPDEGTKAVHMQSRPGPIEAPPVTLSVDGDRSGKEISSRSTKSEDPHSERVREWSPLTANEQHDNEGPESMYCAYAYPLGDRLPSSGNNSAGWDVQRPATKGYGVSS